MLKPTDTIQRPLKQINQVAKMKAEYIPPREDVVMQNEAPEDVYIIVSGEVEIIDCKKEKELVVGTLQPGDMFGELGAVCYRNQSYTYRTKTLSQLLRIKTTALIEAMQTKREENIQMLKNLLQVVDVVLNLETPVICFLISVFSFSFFF